MTTRKATFGARLLVLAFTAFIGYHLTHHAAALGANDVLLIVSLLLAVLLVAFPDRVRLVIEGIKAWRGNANQ